MTSKTQRQLQEFANLAAAKGYQVKFGWSNSLGRSLREITISGFDDWDYQAGEKVEEPIHPSDAHLLNTETIHGFVFTKVEDGPYEHTDQWIARSPDGEQIFELSRQDYDSGDDEGIIDDWGIWSFAEDDWAHDTTGYETKQEAIDAFGRWLKTNN